jgi:hypothetical protein
MVTCAMKTLCQLNEICPRQNTIRQHILAYGRQNLSTVPVIAGSIVERFRQLNIYNIPNTDEFYITMRRKTFAFKISIMKSASFLTLIYKYTYLKRKFMRHIPI